MEPQKNEVESVIAPLKKVTPLSKNLAMALFVALPFIGGYVGYTLVPEKLVEVKHVVIQEVDREFATSSDSMNIESNTPEWDTFTSQDIIDNFSFQYPSSWTLTPGSHPRTIVYVGDVNPVYLKQGTENELNSFAVHYGPGGCAGLEGQADNPVVISSINGKDSLWLPAMVGGCREIQFENDITISMNSYKAEQEEVLEKILSTFKFNQ